MASRVPLLNEANRFRAWILKSKRPVWKGSGALGGKTLGKLTIFTNVLGSSPIKWG